jgi:hypothetical protein
MGWQDTDVVPGGARLCSRFFEQLLPAAGFCVSRHPSAQLLSRPWAHADIAFYRVTRAAEQEEGVAA